MILVSERIEGAALQALRARFDVCVEPDLWQNAAALATRVGQCQALIVRNQTQVTAAVLQNAPQLKVIGRAGVGLDNIDMQTATQQRVVVCYAPGANANAVAELTMAFVLGLSRSLPAATSHTRAGGWDRMAFMGREISGATLAVVGCGAIGRLTARKAQALGMRVVGHDPFLPPTHPEWQALGSKLMSFDEALSRADFVSCHVPSSTGTSKLFDARAFATMRPGACFINTARGGVVDEEALTQALVSGQLGGAALDVRGVEPPPSSELATLPNVWLTPHVGGLTEQAQLAVLDMVCADVQAVLQGLPAQNYANAPGFGR